MPGQRLLEGEVQKDLARLEKDLRGLVRLATLCPGFTDTDRLQETARENLKRHLSKGADLPELKENLFRAAVQQAREQLPGLAIRLTDLVEAILTQRAEIVRRLGTAAGKAAAPARPERLKDLRQLGTAPAPPPAAPQTGTTAAELAALLPPDSLLRVAFDRLQQFPRYLKALAVPSFDRATVRWE